MAQPNWTTLRRIGLPLLLGFAFTFGSLPQAAPAQTPDPDFHYLVDVLNPTYSICVNESRDMFVRILASGSSNPISLVNFDQAGLMLPGGTTVSGEVANPSVGDFTTAHTLLINSPSPSLARPSAVAFSFQGKKVGETTVTFSAAITEFGQTFQALPASATVQVDNCPYDIKITSHYKVQGEDYVADMKWTTMHGDQKGQYTGFGIANWYAHWQVIPSGAGGDISCDTTFFAEPSQVQLTGHLDQHGNLVVNASYQPVRDPYWNVVCSGDGGSIPPVDRREFKLAPALLTITVPAATGGSSTHPQDLIDTMPGHALSFEVVPERH